MIRKQLIITAFISALCATPAVAQSSSLYLDSDEAVAPPFRGANGMVDRSSPQLLATSFQSVRIPERRQFQVQDLVEIIIRESTEASADAALETEKESDFQGQIKSLPPVNLKDLLELQIKGSSTIENPPTVDLNYSSEFEGSGGYERRDTFTTRIQARIIDIKPNGNLVLEARKMVQSDKESMEIVMTGTARPDDVTTANTLLSTQLYDLNLVKKHTGELRQATKKGPLTKLFEILFPF